MLVITFTFSSAKESLHLRGYCIRMGRYYSEQIWHIGRNDNLLLALLPYLSMS